jgi:hypothetical protein
MTFERKIRHALAWMRAAAFADGLARGAVVGAALLLGAVLVAKLAVPRTPWLWALGLAAGASVLWALALYALNRPRLEHAALRLDEAHSLKERFITALHALRSDHEFRDLILADAERHAPSVTPRRAAQPRVRRPLTGAAALLGAAGLAFVLLPDMDILGRKAVAAAREQATVAVAQEARKLDELQKKLTEPRKDAALPEETTRLAKDIADLQKQFAQQHAPGARDAMAKLSTLAEKVEREKEALRKRADATPKSADTKPQEGGGMTSRLERALRRGDLEMAKAELGRLQERAGAPGTSATQTANLGAELKKLAESVEGQQELSAALADAGDALAKADAAAAKPGFDRAKAALSVLDKLQAEAAKLDAALGEIEKSKAELAAAASKESAAGADKGGLKSGGGACKSCGDSSCNGSCQSKSGGKGDTDKPGSGDKKEGQPGREGSGQDASSKFEVGSGRRGGSGQGESAEGAEAAASADGGQGQEAAAQGQ